MDNFIEKRIQGFEQDPFTSAPAFRFLPCLGPFPGFLHDEQCCGSVRHMHHFLIMLFVYSHVFYHSNSNSNTECNWVALSFSCAHMSKAGRPSSEYRKAKSKLKINSLNHITSMIIQEIIASDTERMSCVLLRDWSSSFLFCVNYEITYV